tara:strand:- start:157 stop:612 length:456 start_codon:yes stop_codon:yes gene_type:complete
MNFEKIVDSKIEVNCNNNIENIYELYKSIISKIILANENMLFKTIKSDKKNLKNESCNNFLSFYLEYTIDLIKQNKDENINDLIYKIKLINNQKKEVIIEKVIILVNEYYKYLDRTKLDIESLEKYNISIIKFFKEYYCYNKLEILNIIKN